MTADPLDRWRDRVSALPADSQSDYLIGTPSAHWVEMWPVMLQLPPWRQAPSGVAPLRPFIQRAKVYATAQGLVVYGLGKAAEVEVAYASPFAAGTARVPDPPTRHLDFAVDTLGGRVVMRTRAGCSSCASPRLNAYRPTWGTVSEPANWEMFR